MTIVRALVLVMTLIASAQGVAQTRADPRVSGGDGSSCEKAVILNVHSTVEAAQAEAQWLRQKYGGGKKLSQALVKDPGKWFDTVDWETPNGAKVSTCFDITKVYEEFARRMRERK